MITVDIRLISTNNRPYSGRIEVFFNYEWGKVCFQDNNATLSVVCAQLGFGSFGATPFTTSVLLNSRVWLNSNINCTGNEDTILDCLSPADVANVGKVISGICSNGVANVICPICEFGILYCYTYVLSPFVLVNIKHTRK